MCSTSSFTSRLSHVYYLRLTPSSIFPHSLYYTMMRYPPPPSPTLFNYPALLTCHTLVVLFGLSYVFKTWDPKLHHNRTLLAYILLATYIGAILVISVLWLCLQSTLAVELLYLLSWLGGVFTEVCTNPLRKKTTNGFSGFSPLVLALEARYIPCIPCIKEAQLYCLCGCYRTPNYGL
jgi:hypothetical protein